VWLFWKECRLFHAHWVFEAKQQIIHRQKGDYERESRKAKALQSRLKNQQLQNIIRTVHDVCGSSKEDGSALLKRKFSDGHLEKTDNRGANNFEYRSPESFNEMLKDDELRTKDGTSLYEFLVANKLSQKTDSGVDDPPGLSCSTKEAGSEQRDSSASISVEGTWLHLLLEHLDEDGDKKISVEEFRNFVDDNRFHGCMSKFRFRFWACCDRLKPDSLSHEKFKEAYSFFVRNFFVWVKITKVRPSLLCLPQPSHTPGAFAVLFSPGINLASQ
jgi:hypothetical protein